LDQTPLDVIGPTDTEGVSIEIEGEADYNKVIMETLISVFKKLVLSAILWWTHTHIRVLKRKLSKLESQYDQTVFIHRSRGPEGRDQAEGGHPRKETEGSSDIEEGNHQPEIIPRGRGTGGK
jgi:hypothetical protein